MHISSDHSTISQVTKIFQNHPEKEIDVTFAERHVTFAERHIRRIRDDIVTCVPALYQCDDTQLHEHQ